MHDIDLVLELQPSDPAVFGNHIQLEQVIVNLLSNARDALEHCPARRITIGTREYGRQAEIKVQDSGSGIPRDILPRIFDPFFTTKDVGEGTGLGLWITYGVIKEHGGDIWVESDPGRGTTSVIQLPLADVAGQHATESGAAPCS